MLILVYAALSDSSNGGWKNIHIWTGNPLPSSYVKQSAPRSSHQCNQDKLVVKLYGEDFRGYFVDLAANDAVHISNTLMIERDYNWDGVCIEANPAYWFGLAHRKCTVIGAAVGKTDNEPMNLSTEAPWELCQNNQGLIHAMCDLYLWHTCSRLPKFPL